MLSTQGRAVTVGLVACVLGLAAAAPAGAANGSFERTWGKAVNATTSADACTASSGNVCQGGASGSLGGQFNNPRGMAVDSAGNLYVADASNNRIQVFDAAGNFLRAWGKGVGGGMTLGSCITVGSCLPGTTGTLGGEMSQPTDVAVDSTGVYVADYGNDRIQKFTVNGAFLWAIGKQVNNNSTNTCTNAALCTAGVTGGLGGDFNDPTFISTCCESGEIYVVEAGNRRVQRFNFNGAWGRAWGKDVIQTGGSGDMAGAFEVCTVAGDCKAGASGALGGELSSPYGIATDAAGYVYVADSGNQRIQRYGSGGAWDRAWGKGVDTLTPGIGPEVCTAAPSCLAGAAGNQGGELSSPFDVAVDSSGGLYVADDGASHRVQKFSTTGAWDRAWGKNVNGGGVFSVCTVSASCQAGIAGGLGGEMYGPYGLATDAAGGLYVGELYGNRIDKFGDLPLAAAPGPTGKRAAALKKCKKKKGKARKKCKKKANKLPV